MTREKVQIYGTLGPACAKQEILKEMFIQGMTGMRLNLSHTGLSQCTSWLESFHAAAREAGIAPQLLIDLQGPELRVENDTAYELLTDTTVILGEGGIPVPKLILPQLHVEQQILLDDGKLLLEVESADMSRGTTVVCRVLRGGLLKPRKSIALPGLTLEIPTLTDSDLRNLRVAKEYGVTGVMLPFVRNADDLLCLRRVLAENDVSDIWIFAKIENMDGVKQLPQLLPYADEIVIARGDLGNAMPLWELPGMQYEIGRLCRETGKPYMVVTQMLASMEHMAVPTRAEVSDIFYAVLHGASSVMLTGETAVGEYPVEAIKYMCRTVETAGRYKVTD